MELILLLFKAYIVILMFRYVSTQQELTFNPVGRIIAKVTDPVFNIAKIKREQERFFITLCIVALIMIAVFFNILVLGGSVNIARVILSTLSSFIIFFMLLFMVSVLVGSVVNRGNLGIYVAYFYRLAVPWVKLTRTFIPINGGGITFVTIPMIFVVFTALHFLVMYLGYVVIGINITPSGAISSSLARSLVGLASLFGYAGWLIVIRALLSWTNPDPHGTVVQLLYGLTEPILSPFRRYIPPIGMIDLSAMVAIIVLFFLKSTIERFTFLL